MTSFSIIIPCFNEEKNLPRLFSELESFSRSQTLFNLEVILVDDGSTDTTKILLEDFCKIHSNMKIVSLPVNEGKGAAVRKGMLEALGDWRLFMDADLAVSFDQIKMIVPFMLDKNEVIIGSRRVLGSLVYLPQGLPRQFLGQGFTFLANNITGLQVSDFTCGFKCFSKKATEKIFPKVQINRWTYDVEILYLAHLNGFNICEVGVVWKDGPETKVKIFKDTFWSMVDVIRIRLIHKQLWK